MMRFLEGDSWAGQDRIPEARVSRVLTDVYREEARKAASTWETVRRSETPVFARITLTKEQIEASARQFQKMLEADLEQANIPEARVDRVMDDVYSRKFQKALEANLKRENEAIRAERAAGMVYEAVYYDEAAEYPMLKQLGSPLDREQLAEELSRLTGEDVPRAEADYLLERAPGRSQFERLANAFLDWKTRRMR